MQEALTRHMNGVKFRERGAGPELDPHMTDEGRSTTSQNIPENNHKQYKLQTV